MFEKVTTKRQVFYLALIILIFCGQYVTRFEMTKVDALTTEEQKCQEETKKQGKQYNDSFKMASFYSTKTKTCYFSFADASDSSGKVASGIRQKDEQGNVSVFFQYNGSDIERPNTAITILSINETSQGDVVIGGSIWLPSSDGNFQGYYALLSSTGSKKTERRSGGQSIEKVYADEKQIVLVGSEQTSKSPYTTSGVIPHLITLDLDGNKMSEKTYGDLLGYWFADVKTYKSKYYRVSPAAYKKNDTQEQTQKVRWIDQITLNFVDEQTVMENVQRTFTSEGSLVVEGKEIVIYDKNNRVSKKIPYTNGSDYRSIPLPNKGDDSVIIAELGPTIKLKKIKTDGTVDKTSETNIALAIDDIVDFRELANGGVALQKISTKGEETLVILDLTSFGQKQEESQKSQQNQGRQAKATKEVVKNTEQNLVPFFIAGLIALIVIVGGSILFLKKRTKNKEKTPKKLKKKAPEKIEHQDKVEPLRNAENYYGFNSDEDGQTIQSLNQPYEEYLTPEMYGEQQYTEYIDENQQYEQYPQEMYNNQQYTEYVEYENQQYEQYSQEMYNNQQYTEYVEYENQQYEQYSQEMYNNQQYTEYVEYDAQQYPEYQNQNMYDNQYYSEYDNADYNDGVNNINKKVRE